MLALPGVASCSVSVTTGRASITFKGHGSGGKPSSMEEGTGKEASGVRDVIRAVEGLGFGAKVNATWNEKPFFLFRGNLDGT